MNEFDRLKAKFASNEWANNACLIDSKSRYYRGHCFDDNGRCCKHIKPYPGDDPDDQNTMGCEFGEENCPYVKKKERENG